MKAMVNIAAPLVRRMLMPLAERAGTFVSAFLLAQGVATDTAENAVLALGVIAGVSFDVLVSIMRRKA